MIVPPSPPPIVSWSALLFVIPLLIILFPFWIIGKIGAKKAEKTAGTPPKLWAFLSAGFFMALVVYLAIADLLRVGLNYYLESEVWTGVTYNQLIQTASARMVIILLGLPLLALSWYKATEKSPSEKQEKAEVLTRKYLLGFEAVIFSLIVVLSLGVCLFYLFNWVLGAEELVLGNLSPAIAYGSVALVFLGGKLVCLRKTDTQS